MVAHHAERQRWVRAPEATSQHVVLLLMFKEGQWTFRVCQLWFEMFLWKTKERHTSPRNGFFLHHSCQVGSRYNEVIIHSGNSCHGFLGSLTQALCIWGSQLAPGSSKQSASVNEGIIQEWPSKPGQEHSLTDYRNGSAYLCDKRLFNRVPADDRPDCTENIIAESSRRVLPPTCWKAPAFSVNVSKEFHKWAWGKQHWDSLPVSTPSGPQMTRANANKPEQDGG